jgi:ABC-2 type transport system permease protein
MNEVFINAVSNILNFMNNIFLITKESFLRRLRKIFIILTLLAPVMIIAFGAVIGLMFKANESHSY